MGGRVFGARLSFISAPNPRSEPGNYRASVRSGCTWLFPTADPATECRHRTDQSKSIDSGCWRKWRSKRDDHSALHRQIDSITLNIMGIRCAEYHLNDAHPYDQRQIGE